MTSGDDDWETAEVQLRGVQLVRLLAVIFARVHGVIDQNNDAHRTLPKPLWSLLHESSSLLFPSVMLLSMKP